MVKKFNASNLDLSIKSDDIIDPTSNRKYHFYKSLDNDVLVIALKAKVDVISIIQLTENYIQEANTILPIIKEKELESILLDVTSKDKNVAENAASKLIQISSEHNLKKYSSVSLDFDDIAKFAYDIATSTGYIYTKRKGVEFDYFGENITKLKKAYHNLVHNHDIAKELSNFDLRVNALIFDNSDTDKSKKEDMLMGLVQRSFGEINKSGVYLKLSDLKEDIIKYSKNSNISEKQIDSLSKYFSAQADIKSLFFKMSYHFCLLFSGKEQTAYNETRRIYELSRKMYKETGTINLGYQVFG